MAEDTEVEEEAPKKGKAPLIIGIVLAVLAGGGGFYAASSGMIGGSGDSGSHSASADSYGGGAHAEIGNVSFVAISPILVSLGDAGNAQHLRFSAHIEVEPGTEGNVEALMPRIIDVINGYLRALPTEELERPTALVRLRAHLLRRVQLILGEGQARDLLISEFVLN